MNFLAFDIEAANGYKLYSICSIGIVIADENFNIIHRENVWINPKTKYNLNGTRRNVGIDLHLDKKLLASSPDFSQVYGKIKRLIADSGYVVVGHAVDSDARMLNAACAKYRLPCINFNFICSQLLYKLYKGEDNVKALNKIAADLGLNYHEHNSEDDAWMSMMTLKYLVEDSGLTVAQLLKKFHVRTGANKNFEVVRSVSLDGQISGKQVTREAVDKIKKVMKKIKRKSKLFDGETFSIARSLEIEGSQRTENIVRAIAENGGKYTSYIGKSTVYVCADNPTEQDKMREVRVEELKTQNLLTVVTAEELLKKAGI